MPEIAINQWHVGMSEASGQDAELVRLKAMEATLMEMKHSEHLQYRQTYYHFFEREDEAEKAEVRL